MATSLWVVKKFGPETVGAAREGVEQVLAAYPDLGWERVLSAVGYHLERRRQSGALGHGEGHLLQTAARFRTIYGWGRFGRGKNAARYLEVGRRLMAIHLGMDEDTPAGILKDVWLERNRG